MDDTPQNVEGMCPNCQRTAGFELVMSLSVTWPAHVAGVQAKMSATTTGTLICVPERGGCGFTVTGRVEGGSLVVEPAAVEAALAALRGGG